MNTEERIKPASDRMKLAGKLGLETRLTPDAAEALGNALEALARLDDLNTAREFGLLQLAKLTGGALVCIAALVLIAWFAA